MAYQKTKELFSPILQFLNRGEYSSIPDIIRFLADEFDLDEDFLNKRYEISNAKIFDNTVYWKLNDLEKAGLLEFKKEAGKRAYIISTSGKEFLNRSSEEISGFIRETYLKKVRNGTVISPADEDEQLLEEAETPLEQLETSYKKIQSQLYETILDTILGKSPSAFEKIVTELLQKMGYGDGKVTQLSRDGGIDAIIKGDVLGFEQIYVQAKRYQRDSVISRKEIQGFTGALLGLEGNATKGVFITTARFSQDAENFAQNFSKARIVLIDGKLLAKYIYDYELGVQIEKEFSIKKLDNDFWDMFQDSE
ncbi:restriction endonuclease [Neisseria yangbaofengii]|uniref:restriction endonuclease n=1 Tax=Neisseria yangbaofengii TaxID=2709396 RepID=UPI0013EB9AD7|nr:restriction endonuclease [Neisseria yangbaofengii]